MAQTKDVAKEETTRQAVIMAFSVATMAVILVMHDADQRRIWRMQAALAAKRFSQRQADLWQDLADRAASAYNREKA